MGSNMQIDEKITRLQNLINRKVTYEDIAHSLGMSGNALRNWVYRNRELKEFEIRKIDNYFKITTQNNTQTDSITLDYYPEVCGSCGNGVFQFSTKKELMSLPESAFSHFSPVKQYFVINAYGDSMQPIILDKDKLIIEHYEGESIIDNRTYLFCFNDELFIKKLAKNVNQLLIIPENKNYDIIKLVGSDMNKVDILGRVVGLLRDLR